MLDDLTRIFRARHPHRITVVSCHNRKATTIDRNCRNGRKLFFVCSAICYEHNAVGSDHEFAGVDHLHISINALTAGTAGAKAHPFRNPDGWTWAPAGRAYFAVFCFYSFGTAGIHRLFTICQYYRTIGEPRKLSVCFEGFDVIVSLKGKTFKYFGAFYQRNRTNYSFMHYILYILKILCIFIQKPTKLSDKILFNEVVIFWKTKSILLQFWR